MPRIVKCQECNKVLNQDNPHADFSNCDGCGSEKISYFLSFSEKVNMNEQLKGKSKVPGVNKPRKEFIYGDEQYKKENKMVDKTRIIDRENDHYYEKVVDKETKEVIHLCDEPLSKHFGHGSAKNKKR
jgi:hypothetical protein